MVALMSMKIHIWNVLIHHADLVEFLAKVEL